MNAPGVVANPPDPSRYPDFRETRECQLCHRVGYKWFVPYGDYGWVCMRERACIRRRTEVAS